MLQSSWRLVAHAWSIKWSILKCPCLFTSLIAHRRWSMLKCPCLFKLFDPKSFMVHGMTNASMFLLFTVFDHSLDDQCHHRHFKPSRFQGSIYRKLKLNIEGAGGQGRGGGVYTLHLQRRYRSLVCFSYSSIISHINNNNHDKQI